MTPSRGGMKDRKLDAPVRIKYLTFRKYVILMFPDFYSNFYIVLKSTQNHTYHLHCNCDIVCCCPGAYCRFGTNRRCIQSVQQMKEILYVKKLEKIIAVA